MFMIIVFRLWCDRPLGLLFFVLALLLSMLMSLFVPFFSYHFCFFVLFHSYCSHARVFGKTLVHDFPISCSHTEWYLLFHSVKAMNNWKWSLLHKFYWTKTKTMIVSRSHTMHPQSPTLIIGRTVLKEFDDLVVLGVTFDSNICFEKCLCSVSRVAS